MTCNFSLRVDARLLVLLLLALLPAASAATVSGALHFHEAPRVEGNVTLIASPARVEVMPGPGPVLSWLRAEGSHEGRTGIETGAGTAAGTARWSTPISLGPGVLRVAECRPGCRVALLIEDGEGAAGATGAYSGTLDHLVVPADETVALEASPAAAHLRVGEHGAALGLAEETGLAAFAHGRGRLVLWNVSVDLVTAEGATRLDTGARQTHLADPRVPAWRTNVSHAVLSLEGAELRAPASRIFAPSLDARLDGLLGSTSASGWVEVDDKRVSLERAPFQVLGSLHVHSSALAPGPLEAEGARGAIAGEADSVRLGAYAQRFETGPAPPAPGWALAAAGLLLLLAAKLALLPSYSRLSPRTLLSNENRERLYALVCDRPGESVAPLAAAAGMGRMVAQYHLRVLEKHRLVMGQGEGRLRLYFPCGARRPDEDAVSVLMVLRSPTRRAIAALLRDAPDGRTQAELAALSGVSQRLVSYHLQALEKGGLVEASGGRPRRFRAAPALEKALP